MLLADDWIDYKIIDTGDGEKLERWGRYILRRPDPQVIWPKDDSCAEAWEKADACYMRSSAGGGSWEFRGKLPDKWQISYNELKFYIQPTNFKHTGLFPEQAVNWKWVIEKIRDSIVKTGQAPSVLNLFAYTGGATAAAAAAGAEVCHVDAAKGMVVWAKENLALSGLAGKPVRYITDDVFKFVQREKRRGRKYDAVIMDPPSYGRGPGGEVWKLEDALYRFIAESAEILKPEPLFFLLNSYTTGFSPAVPGNILRMSLGLKFGGKVECGEVGLPVGKSGIVLPCGTFARWEK